MKIIFVINLFFFFPFWLNIFKRLLKIGMWWWKDVYETGYFIYWSSQLIDKAEWSPARTSRWDIGDPSFKVNIYKYIIPNIHTPLITTRFWFSHLKFKLYKKYSLIFSQWTSLSTRQFFFKIVKLLISYTRENRFILPQVGSILHII